MMKKILLATTALVATGMIAGQAVAAEPVKVSVGGYIGQHFGFANNDTLTGKAAQTIVASGATATANQVNVDNAGAVARFLTTATDGSEPYQPYTNAELRAAYSATNPLSNVTIPAVTAREARNNTDMNSDTELYFHGSTKLDNGLTVGVHIDLEADRSEATNTDDSFLTIGSDSMGTLTIGSTKHVAYGIQQAAPDVGRIYLSDGFIGRWVKAPTVAGGFNAFHGKPNATSTDSHKFTYVSPDLGGLKIGASWAPSESIDQTIGVKGKGPGDDGHMWTAGLIYSGTFNDFGVTADVGYGAKKRTGKLVQAGLKVTYAGFTIGGGFARTSVGDSDKGGVVSTIVNNNEAAVSIAGTSYSFGVAYEMDALKVSLGYGKSSREGMERRQVAAAVAATATDPAVPATFVGFADDNVNTTIMLSANYALGPGVEFTTSIFQQDYEGENPYTKEDDNSGLAVVGGLRVNF